MGTRTRLIAAGAVVTVVLAGALYIVLRSWQAPVTADELAGDPAMTHLYPGALTLDGRVAAPQPDSHYATTEHLSELDILPSSWAPWGIS